MVSPEPDSGVTAEAPGGEPTSGLAATEVAPAVLDLDQLFDQQGLIALRAAVSAHAGRLGLVGERLEDLVVIAHELASNAVRHGGGTGRLRLWRIDGSTHCEISDSGQGLSDPVGAGYDRVPISAANGRGLWIVRQLADEVRIDSTDQGTTVTVVLAL